jgi:hypothetical protein
MVVVIAAMIGAAIHEHLHDRADDRPPVLKLAAPDSLGVGDKVCELIAEHGGLSVAQAPSVQSPSRRSPETISYRRTVTSCRRQESKR